MYKLLTLTFNMTRRLWEEELREKWRSIAYWDDWLREPVQRKGRQVLVPEVCRTFHFGTVGTSNGQFSDLLEGIKLNEQYVDFSDEQQQRKWSHLRNDKAYEEWLCAQVCAAKEIGEEGYGLLERQHSTKETKLEGVRLVYTDNAHFVSLAKRLGIFSDKKAGVFRTSYKGIVSIYVRGRRVHLAPQGHDCLRDC